MAVTAAIYLLLSSIMVAEAGIFDVCECKGIVINCENKGLTDVPGDDVFEYLQIQLSGNLLTSLNAASFTSFPKAVHLYIRDNAVSKVAGSSFENLPNLESLDLSRNRLQELPVHSTLSKMKNLLLMENYFTNTEDINTAIAMMSNLQYLDVSDNRLTGLNATAPLFEHANVKTLIMARCSLRRLQAGAFSGLPSLATLNLKENSLLDLGLSLADLQSVRSLVLTATSLASLSPGQLPVLVEAIHLDGNPLAALNLEALSNLTSLSELDMSDTTLSCTCDSAFRRLRTWASENNVTLKTSCGGENVCGGGGGGDGGGGGGDDGDDEDDSTTTAPIPGAICRWNFHCSDGQKCCYQMATEECPVYGRCVASEQCSAAPVTLTPTAVVLFLTMLVISKL